MVLCDWHWRFGRTDKLAHKVSPLCFVKSTAIHLRVRAVEWSLMELKATFSYYYYLWMVKVDARCFCFSFLDFLVSVFFFFLFLSPTFFNDLCWNLSAELLVGITKEIETGRLPSSVASGMEELYHNYKNAVNKSIFLNSFLTDYIHICCRIAGIFLFLSHYVNCIGIVSWLSSWEKEVYGGIMCTTVQLYIIKYTI